MSNLLDNVITIQACEQIRENTSEYSRQTELAKKVVEKFKLSRDLQKHISILFTYQLNGLCSIDWNKWLALPNSKQEVVALVSETKAYINEIVELNPEKTAEIREAIRRTSRMTPKMQKNNSFDF